MRRRWMGNSPPSRERAKSRRSSIMRAIRSALAAILATTRACRSGSSPYRSKSCAEVTMAVSGLRRSWLTMPTKCSRNRAVLSTCSSRCLRVVPREQRRRARGDGAQKTLLVFAELPDGARGKAQHAEQFVAELQGEGEHPARVLRIRPFDDASLQERAAGDAGRIGRVWRELQAGRGADYELPVLTDEQGGGVGGQRALHRQFRQTPHRSIGERSFQGVEGALGR